MTSARRNSQRPARYARNQFSRASVAPSAFGARRGSVLVPMVAAMLILLLMGVALSEVFAAQRMKGVLGIESRQAFWAAEAGLWHAAHEQAAISSPVTFGGCDYTVTKNGDNYTATCRRDQATRVVSLTLSGPGSGASSPLDQAASAASAKKKKKSKFSIKLVSQSPVDVVLEAFELSTTASSKNVKKITYQGKKLWDVKPGIALPTGRVAFNKGSAQQRTVASGSSFPLDVDFKPGLKGNQPLTLILHFTDSSSSTLQFSIKW